MNVCIKSGLLLQILIFLSSCSLIGGLGFGSKDECADGACETPQILDNRPSNKNWYCYGVPADRSWDCVSQPLPEKIATVIPGPGKSQSMTPAAQEEVISSSIVAPQSDLPDIADRTPPGNSEDGAMAIIGQSADFFTVQLIALQQEDRVLDYARHNGIEHPLYARIKNIENQDGDWYVLLLGFYPDRSAAESAWDEFEGARQLKIRPWIRQLAPLQDAIRSAQQAH